MSFPIEKKLEKLVKKGWVLTRYVDTNGTPKISAKFFEPVGRDGNRKPTPLYNLIFNNQNDLVRELYYSSIGTQRELAKEYGLSPEEISYIKQSNKYYTRNDKEYGEIKVQINAGRLVKCIDDINLFLSQIQNRPYSIKVRKELLNEEDCRKNIETICNLLSQRTGYHFMAEYVYGKEKKDYCVITVDDIFHVYSAPIKDYLKIFAYLNSTFLLTDTYKSANQREVIHTLLSL